MIRHIVLFRLRPEGADERAAAVAGMRERLTGLVGVVPSVNTIEVQEDLGIVDGHWDVALVTEHDSNDDLEAYQRHPSHQEVVAWVSTVISDRATVDYEF